MPPLCARTQSIGMSIIIIFQHSMSQKTEFQQLSKASMHTAHSFGCVNDLTSMNFQKKKNYNLVAANCRHHALNDPIYGQMAIASPHQPLPIMQFRKTGKVQFCCSLPRVWCVFHFPQVFSRAKLNLWFRSWKQLFSFLFIFPCSQCKITASKTSGNHCTVRRVHRKSLEIKLKVLSGFIACKVSMRIEHSDL